MSGDSAGRPLRIGIAGLGFGVEVHLPAWHSIPGVEVVALQGRRSERAQEVAKRTGLPVLSDPTAWLDYKPDAVSIALPPEAVLPVVTTALERKLPVLCEKPLGASPAEADRLVAMSEGLVTCVDFQFAELKTFEVLKQAIQDGVLGTLRHASVTWLTHSFAHRSQQWSWKTDARRGGGALTLLGTHLLYLAECLLGPATRLSARLTADASTALAPTSEAIAADDLIILTTEHQDGRLLTAIVGNANPGMSVHRWTIIGTRGSAIIENLTKDYMSGFVLRIVDDDGRALITLTEPEEGGDGRILPFRRLATRFLGAVRDGGSCRPDFNDGARVARLTDAVRRSAETQGYVNVADNCGREMHRAPRVPFGLP